ncbi:MAG: hypothetical protein ACOYCB_12490, partial [Fastidiosipilaceae bacterium]
SNKAALLQGLGTTKKATPDSPLKTAGQAAASFGTGIIKGAGEVGAFATDILMTPSDLVRGAFDENYKYNRLQEGILPRTKAYETDVWDKTMGKAIDLPDTAANEAAEMVGSIIPSLAVGGGGTLKAVKGVKKASEPVAKALKDLAKKTPTAVKKGVGIGAVATGYETIKGATDPEYADRRETLPSQIGASLRGGVGDTVKLAGSVAEWKDQHELADSLKKTGAGISEGYDSKQVPFSWKSFFDPDWYANNAARSIPTTAALIPAMVIFYKGGAKIAGMRGFGKFGQAVIGSLAGSVASRPMESALEAGGTYEDALARGMTEDEATAAAQKVYEANLKLAGLDAAQLAAAFAPAPIKPASKLGKAGMAATKLGGVAGTEALEEGYQQAVQQQATGADTRGILAQMLNPNTEMKESMAIGGLFGLGTGGAGVINDVYRTRIEPSQVNDIWDNIKARTIESLPDSVMPQVKQRVEEYVQQGVPPKEAVDMVLDEVTEVPEVQEAISRITQEEANKVVGEITDTSTGATTTPSIIYSNKTNEPLQIIDDSNPEFLVVQNANNEKLVVARDDVSIDTPERAQQAEAEHSNIISPKEPQSAPVEQIETFEPVASEQQPEIQPEPVIPEQTAEVVTPEPVKQEVKPEPELSQESVKKEEPQEVNAEVVSKREQVEAKQEAEQKEVEVSTQTVKSSRIKTQGKDAPSFVAELLPDGTIVIHQYQGNKKINVPGVNKKLSSSEYLKRGSEYERRRYIYDSDVNSLKTDELAGVTPYVIDRNLDAINKAVADALKKSDQYTDTFAEKIEQHVKQKQNESEQVTSKIESKEEAKDELPEQTSEPSQAEPSSKEVGDYTITKTKHTKTGADIWVVKPKTKLSNQEFTALNAKMRKLGGGYSKFTKGFNFKEDPTSKLQPEQEVKPDSKSEPGKPESKPEQKPQAQQPEKPAEPIKNKDRSDDSTKKAEDGVELNQEEPAKEGEQGGIPDQKILEPGNEEGVSGGRLPSGTNVDSIRGTGGEGSGVSGENVGSVAGEVPVQQSEHGSNSTRPSANKVTHGSNEGRKPKGAADGSDDSHIRQQRGDGKDTNRDTDGSSGVPGEPEGSTDKQTQEEEQSKVAYENFRINEDNPVFVKGSKKARYEANIEALKTLDKVLSENREPTIEEQRKLALFSGWGALHEVFTYKYEDESSYYRPGSKKIPKYKDWEKEFYYTKELLDGIEERHFEGMYNYRGGLYENASGSTMNAHYTSPAVISCMFDALQQMGFKRGNLLEPSMGTGNFFGMLPDTLRSKTKLYGVELDPVTGKIAQLLYPNADIRIQGFQKSLYPDNFFDAVVGNVPFGAYQINDKNYPKFVTERIHNYFFARSLDKVKPGGIVAFISSVGTMDAPGNQRVREYLSQKANLVGAIRLPGDAFKDNAGTEVTTDIIFLQKLKEGELPGDINWTKTGEVEVDGSKYPLNQYYI